METPLGKNKFIGKLLEARKDGKSEFIVDGQTYQVEGSAIKMVDQMNPSLVQTVDPMSGMPKPNQMNLSMVNPQALGSMQNRISNISGNQIPGSFNRVVPSPLPNNHDKDLVGENTDEIKKDKKGREYSLVMEDSKNFKKGDTIRPSNNVNFNKSIRSEGYIMGGDYKVDKKNRIKNK